MTRLLLNRIFREDESKPCEVCGSGKSAHRSGGPRSDHRFQREPRPWGRWAIRAVTWPIALWVWLVTKVLDAIAEAWDPR